VVGGESAVESEERGAHVQGFGREAVDDVGGSGKGIGPIFKRHRDLKK
jgi:hypothetical protein